MKKIQILLLSFAVLGANASTATRRTMYTSRPVVDDMAVLNTGFNNRYKSKIEKNLNFTFQAAALAKSSVNGNDLGKYFGVNGKNTINIEYAANLGSIIADDTKDVWNRFLVHRYDGVNSDKIRAHMELSPKQEVFGAILDLFGFLNDPLKKTYFQITSPIVYVSNDLNLKYTDTTSYYTDIETFFNGQVVNEADTNNSQDQLQYLKIMQKNRTAFGVADVDAKFGYRLIENKSRHVYLSALCTIPTGNKPKSEYLFEPIYGNSNHFALGWNLDTAMRFWKSTNHQGWGYFTLTHKYLFDGTERRTIPLNTDSYPFGHYYLAGKIGATAGTSLAPLANILTQDIRVRPGNQVEALAGFQFKSKRFALDAAYNLFFKEKEAVSLKSTWQDNNYGIAQSTFDVSTSFLLANALNGKAINNSDLNLSGAATPNQLTHKFLGVISYLCSQSNRPANLSLGASYEFTDDNHSIECYEFWLKAGISF